MLKFIFFFLDIAIHIFQIFLHDTLHFQIANVLIFCRPIWNEEEQCFACAFSARVLFYNSNEHWSTLDNQLLPNPFKFLFLVQQPGDFPCKSAKQPKLYTNSAEIPVHIFSLWLLVVGISTCVNSFSWGCSRTLRLFRSKMSNMNWKCLWDVAVTLLSFYTVWPKWWNVLYCHSRIFLSQFISFVSDPIPSRWHWKSRLTCHESNGFLSW